MEEKQLSLEEFAGTTDSAETVDKLLMYFIGNIMSMYPQIPYDNPTILRLMEIVKINKEQK